MDTKEQLINNIKEWMKIDTELADLNKQMKEKKNKKKILTENLVTVMKTNKIDCFDINGGSLIYKTSKIKKPINGKSLLAALQKYYANDVKTAEDLTKHIMESREEKIKETIKHKIDK